jgi:hypothetical protein
MDTRDIQLYELYDLWYTPFWKQWWVIGIIVTFCLFLITIALYWWLCIRKIRVLVKDPWQEALDSLYAINLSLFEDLDHHRILYHELTNILKQYVSKLYLLDLQGKTDSEWLAVLASSQFPRDLQVPLRSIMEGALTIKFAHQDVAMEQMRFDIVRSIDIVRNTIPTSKK